MNNTEKLQRLTIINRLLAPFPSSQGAQGDDSLDGYLIGTAEIPVDYLAVAAGRFLAGQVPGQHMTFPPTPAQLATEAREHWYKAIERERAEQARLAPPKQPDIVHSPESQDRVRAMTAKLVADLGTAARTEDAARNKLEKERVERETRWLRDRGDLVEVKGAAYPISHALAKQLGIGDPEGDRDVA
jgi:hypothetical protein